MASRVKNTARNTVYAAFRFLLGIVLQFALRSAFIYTLGKEILGLDNLIVNVIMLLNITELGISAAIGYRLYKPIAEKDNEMIKSLYAFYVKIYRFVICAIAAIGLCVMPFLNYFIKGGGVVGINIYVIYLIVLSATVMSYFVASKRTLIYSSERSDILSKATSANLIFTRVLQIILLLTVKNYYLFAIIIPMGVVLEFVCLNIVTKKFFPFLRENAKKLDKNVKVEIYKNVFGLGLSKLGGVASTSIIAILISVFFGLGDLAIYANYLLIFSCVCGIMDIFIGSVQASVGNMIASESKERNYNMFNVLNFAHSLLFGFGVICLLCLYQPFLETWINADWLFPAAVMITLVIRLYVMRVESVVGIYKNCAGLMWNDKFIPLVTLVLQVSISILLLKFFGIAGIFIGISVAILLSSFITTPWVLYKRYFLKSPMIYFSQVFIFTLVTVFAGGVSYYLCSILPDGIWFHVLRLGVCVGSTAIIYLLAFISTPSFRALLGTFKGVITHLSKH
jgi:O-antigen/teichoic acid export membrane protein